MLADPSVVEQIGAESHVPARVRERLLSVEGALRRAALQARKAQLAAAVRRTGAEVIGQTEVVLNSLLVRATDEQLQAVRGIAGVASAQFARRYELLLDAAVPLVNGPQTWSSPSIGGEDKAGRGIKIAIIDSGIDNTHPMFQDAGLTPPSGFPKGDTNYTNSKLIVARQYVNDTPQDNRGHGTFVAAVAAGGRVQSQSPSASISGVAPKAFLGNYRVFPTSGSAGETAVLSAINDAVADGMDIINMSLGSPAQQLPTSDPDYMAIENARRAGVLVVAAAGNSGPAATDGSPGRSVSSPCALPQVLCAGSVTNAHSFFATVRITSTVEVPSSVSEIPSYPGSQPKQTGPMGPLPLVDVSTLDPSGLACPQTATFPSGVNLPASSLDGKIVLIRRGTCFFRDKIRNVQNAGAKGAIIYNHNPGGPPVNMDTSATPALLIPSMGIGNDSGLALKSFLSSSVLSSGSQVLAAFDPDLTGRPVTADILVGDSSRGPAPDLEIKPDLVAPGESILSATQNLNSSGDMYAANRYFIASGTSFSSPMTAGVAALVKQAHPGYTPEQIKSALVNNAVPISATQDKVPPRVQNSGAGRVDALAAVQATVAAEPVSLSFDNTTHGFVSSDSHSLKVTNLSSSTDTLTLALAVNVSNPNVSPSLTSSSLTLGPNQSGQVLLNVSYSGLVEASAEGVINITSQATGKTSHVPFWVSPAPPSVTQNGVVISANYKMGVAPGSLIAIFGSALASVAEAKADSLPLPTTLGGAQVSINGTNAPLLYVSSHQINAQLPFDLDTTVPASVAVKVDGLSSASSNFSAAAFGPGLYSMDGSGSGPGAIVHADGSLVTAQNPATAGEVLLVYGTGLGAVTNQPANGAAALSDPLSRSSTNPDVLFGKAQLKGQVQFSGLAPTFVGLYQVNVQVPAGLSSGENPLPLTLQIGGVTSNAVTIFIR